MDDFAPLPAPPYYAVIFASRRRGGGAAPDEGYGAMADRMAELAARQPGFLGMETARDGQGFGITVSYWASEAALKAWKEVAEHALAQKLGRTRWYERYSLRVARVERQYEGPAGREPGPQA